MNLKSVSNSRQDVQQSTGHELLSVLLEVTAAVSYVHCVSQFKDRLIDSAAV